MKIESIIRRAEGSTVVLGTNSYHFTPGEDGRHVCEVEDEAHIDRLLSIKEGFREVETGDQNGAPVSKPAPDPAAVVKKAEGEAKPKGGRKAKAADGSDKQKPPAETDPAAVKKAEGEA